MKNTASRILALIVALSMLLVPTAFAAERNAASVTVGNIELTMGEETLSLPLYLTLGGGADIAGMRGYLTANLSTAEQTALAAVAALENGELKAYLNGMNTGFTISLDQIVSMIEDEMGASLEDMMTMYAGELESTLTPEMQESLMNLLTQAAALPLDYGSELGPKDIVTAMGATVTDIGKTTVTLFDVEAEGTESSLTMAPTTVKAMYDGLGELLPEVGAIYTEYFSFMNQLLASQGEDMTIEQALEMITVSMEGTIYTAKAGSAGNVVVTISVEGESIDLYVYVVTLTDEYGTYAECTLDMPIDGEGMYVDVYIDDYTDETGSYKSAIYSFDIYDVETSETEIGCMTTLVLSDTEEGVTAAAEFYMVEGEETTSLGISHLCYEVEQTEEYDSYNGLLYAYMIENGEVMDITMDTNLTLTSVPEGELLTFTQSVNPFEIDEETLSGLMTEASTALMQGLGVLMQDATIAGMLSGLMG